MEDREFTRWKNNRKVYWDAYQKTFPILIDFTEDESDEFRCLEADFQDGLTERQSILNGLEACYETGEADDLEPVINMIKKELSNN